MRWLLGILQEIWDSFTSMAMLHGLEVESRGFEPHPGDEGLCSEDRNYEGGFIFARITKTFTNAIASSCRH